MHYHCNYFTIVVVKKTNFFFKNVQKVNFKTIDIVDHFEEVYIFND